MPPCAKILVGEMVWENEEVFVIRLDSTEVEMIHMITDQKEKHFRDQ